MKYCFEMYEFSDKGRIFKGYKSVNAYSVDEAKEIAGSKLASNIRLVQIYIPQENV